jgi:hypothetical protein
MTTSYRRLPCASCHHAFHAGRTPPPPLLWPHAAASRTHAVIQCRTHAVVPSALGRVPPIWRELERERTHERAGFGRGLNKRIVALCSLLSTTHEREKDKGLGTGCQNQMLLRIQSFFQVRSGFTNSSIFDFDEMRRIGPVRILKFKSDFFKKIYKNYVKN